MTELKNQNFFQKIIIIFKNVSIIDYFWLFFNFIYLFFFKRLIIKINNKIYTIIINSFFKKYKYLSLENNCLKNLSNFKLNYFINKYLLLIHKKDKFKNWDLSKEIIILNKYFKEKKKSGTLLLCSIGKDYLTPINFKLLGYKVFCFDVRKIKSKFKILFRLIGIRFELKDLYKLDYNRTFDYISLCSTIEHLDNYELLFDNLSRVSHNETILFITTDYWPEKINTTGLFPFGVNQPEMKVLSTPEIENFLSIAKKYGFILIDNKVDYSVTEKIVTWEKMQKSYTFISLLMKKIN